MNIDRTCNGACFCIMGGDLLHFVRIIVDICKCVHYEKDYSQNIFTLITLRISCCHSLMAMTLRKKKAPYVNKCHSSINLLDLSWIQWDVFVKQRC